MNGIILIFCYQSMKSILLIKAESRKNIFFFNINAILLIFFFVNYYRLYEFCLFSKSAISELMNDVKNYKLQ